MPGSHTFALVWRHANPRYTLLWFELTPVSLSFSASSPSSSSWSYGDLLKIGAFTDNNIDPVSVEQQDVENTVTVERGGNGSQLRQYFAFFLPHGYELKRLNLRKISTAEAAEYEILS